MDLFLKLFLTHLLTDFFLQPSSWVKKRVKSNKMPHLNLILHVLLTGFVAWAFLSFNLRYGLSIGVLVVSHFLIDYLKALFGKENLLYFLVDQVLHVLVLVFIAMNHESLFTSDFLKTIYDGLNNHLFIIVGYVLILHPAGFFVGYATRRWQNILNDAEERDSLKDAGKWIGILERFLVLTFVMVGQMSAIGFLIAAKSILRFSDKDSINPRAQTEYVLIGTLLSFTIALIVGIVLKRWAF